MINRIQIENFKSIRKMDLELGPINVLIGANGVGKSNFIGFFKLLRSIYYRKLREYVGEEAGAENILYFGLKNSEHLYLRVEFDNINAYYLKLVPTREGQFNLNREGTQFYRTTGDGWDKLDLDSKGSYESHLINQEGNWGRYSYVKEYMTSFKIFHFHDTSKTAKIKQQGALNDNYFLREDGSNLAAYLYLLQERYSKAFKKIEMAIRAIAPYFEAFNLQPDRLNEDYIRLEWKEKGSDTYFNASHLSDGTLRFMALATLLLQPEMPPIIIIDEPELGLHPFAINKLASLIKKASTQTQIIIATQSVNLLDNFTPEDIITVDRKDKQSVFQRQNTAHLQDWLENYSVSAIWNKNVIGGRP